MRKAKDLTGLTFDKLLVIKSVRENNILKWLCQCTCPDKNIVISKSNALTSGRTKSCGCHRKELARLQGLANKKHGASKRISIDGSVQLDYVIWRKIKERCYSKNSKNYKRYGKRNIVMYKPWCKDFSIFAKYIRTLENCPDEETLVSRLFGRRLIRTLDRINNDGNYEPGNLKWATKKEQANNRSTNIIVSYNGETLTLKQTVEKFSDNSYKVVYQRIYKSGWSLENALEPLKKRYKIRLFRRTTPNVTKTITKQKQECTKYGK